jgi:phosphotriesterase-related protein
VTYVQTLRGAVAADELGATLMHEHVFMLHPEIIENVETDWDEETALVDAARRLDELYAAGIHTIVDLTVIGLGRSVRRLQRVPASSAINIVVATGEIEEGIGDTGVRAGILKCATDEAGVTPGVEKILRAVAQAHVRTGAPISTHTHAATRRGLDQLKIFAGEGVDPTRVVIGHSGDSTDLDYLLAIADSGAYVGMDRFGIDTFLGFDDRVATVARLCALDRTDQIVLSHDASCYNIDYSHGGSPPKALPNWHYLHITRDVVPALKCRGVTDEQITQMLVVNPRRVLSHARSQ